MEIMVIDIVWFFIVGIAGFFVGRNLLLINIAKTLDKELERKNGGVHYMLGWSECELYLLDFYKVKIKEKFDRFME